MERRYPNVILCVFLLSVVAARAHERPDGPTRTPVRIDCGDELEKGGRCAWQSDGVAYEVRPSGRLVARKGSGAAVTALLPVPPHNVIESIAAGSVDGDVLLVYGITDSEGGGTRVVRLDANRLRVRWSASIPVFNASQTIDGGDLFLAGIGFVSRLDLGTGRFVWKLSGLYNRDDFAFSAFKAPVVLGNDVIFVERQGAESKRADKRLVVNRATGQARLDREVAWNGHDSDAATFNRMLGVECTHCHVAGDWKSDANPKLAVARKMRQMVDELNRTNLKGTGGVSCWTCHEGHIQPRRLPSPSWTAVRDGAFVGDLAPLPDGTKVTMSVYAASLGVKCEHCHVAGDWKASSKPAYRMAERMIAMFDVFPAYMPAGARTQCFMCHKGSPTPKR